ncbi:MAG: PorT family protein [Bacteroidia bacterium]|nr:PorT family protein [Bacteroidia bacterium]
MKKAIFLVLLISLSIQTPAQKNFVQVGLLAGPSWVNLYGNPFIETFLEPEFRFTGGPTVYYPFHKHFAVKSNLFFESKGSGGILPLFDEAGEPLGIHETEVHYNYLTIPLLFDYYFGRRLKGNLTAGPYLGVMLNQNTTYTKPVGGESIVEKGTANFIPWDGGLVLGTGGRYTLSKRFTVSIEGRYNIGLTNIVSRPVMGSLTIYNLSTQIMLGIFYTPGYQAGRVRNSHL